MKLLGTFLIIPCLLLSLGLPQTFSHKHSRFRKPISETIKEPINYSADVAEVKLDVGSVTPWAVEQPKVDGRKLQSVEAPPDCITDESQLVYVNGIISVTETFRFCLSQIAEPMSIPSFYNGAWHGIVDVYNDIQLNNLHEVTLSQSFSSESYFCFFSLSTGRRRRRNRYHGFLFAIVLAGQPI
jgi:hypothetical protein